MSLSVDLLAMGSAVVDLYQAVTSKMDALMPAAIGAAGTIIGATIPKVFELYKSAGGYHLSSRRTVLGGLWVGDGVDLYAAKGGPLLSFKISMTLDISGRRVKGTGHLEIPERNPQDVSMKGGFYNEDFIQLSYISMHSGHKQLGVIIFEINGTGSELTGQYAGYSPTRNCFVTGKVKLSKTLGQGD